MREIKFRAWDSYRMRTWSDITETLGFHNWIYSTPKSVTIMQYTGLKDKNGREAYEGDIYHYNGFNHSIVWSENQSGWRNNYGMKLPKMFGKPVWEVIGNIYENPELLK